MNKRKQNLKYERPQTQAKNWHKYDKIIQPIIRQECKPFTLKDLNDLIEKQDDFIETSDNWPVYNPDNGVFEPKQEFILTRRGNNE